MVRMSCLTRQHCWFFFFFGFHLVESHFKALQGLSLHARRSVGDANKPSYFAVVFLPRAMDEQALPPGRYFSIFTIISDYGKTCWK